VTLTPNHDSLLLEAVDVHKVVLAAEDNVLRVRGPTDAQQSAKVRPGQADELEGVVDENAEVAVLRHDGKVMTARREGKLVETAFPDCPFVKRVARTLDFAGVDGEPAALFVELVGRRARAAHELVVVDVDVPAGVGDEKAGRRFWKPLDASHSTLVNVALQRKFG